jgi:E3 ubiquitin-protein ligase CCNP1IP1
VCPACGESLPNGDDAVITDLNPPDDYKTSVLSGLSPNIILECSGRALSFWAYQATSEMFVFSANSTDFHTGNKMSSLTRVFAVRVSVYQQYLYNTLAGKYSDQSHQLDKVTSDSNAEIERLNNKNASTHLLCCDLALFTKLYSSHCRIGKRPS